MNGSVGCSFTLPRPWLGLPRGNISSGRLGGNMATFTLEEVIRRALESRLEGVNTALPAEIVSYDASTSLAVVRPCVRVPRFDADGFVVSYEQIADVPGVPIAWPRGGAGGWSLTWPLSPGDGVLLVVSSRDPSGYREGQGGPGDPASLRLHGLSGAWAIPCVGPDAGALPPATSPDLVVSTPGDDYYIALGASSASDFVVKAPPSSTDWFADIVAVLSLVNTQLMALGQPGMAGAEWSRLLAGTDQPTRAKRVKVR